MAIPYSCPFCGKDSILFSGSSFRRVEHVFEDEDDKPRTMVTSVFRLCPSPECRQFSLEVGVVARIVKGGVQSDKSQGQWRLIPPSAAKAFPEYIPESIRQDYQEACLIVDRSPKASATLARRCLQGMIRDFWKVAKARLFDEIETIKDKVDPITWKAIDGLRKIGNIGAHMEQDVNLLIDVEPDEAAKLIWLIELLMREWYIHRHERELGLKELDQLAANKQIAKGGQVPEGK
jgi:hypothetical protein